MPSANEWWLQLSHFASRAFLKVLRNARGDDYSIQIIDLEGMAHEAEHSIEKWGKVLVVVVAIILGSIFVGLAQLYLPQSYELITKLNTVSEFQLPVSTLLCFNGSQWQLSPSDVYQNGTIFECAFLSGYTTQFNCTYYTNISNPEGPISCVEVIASSTFISSTTPFSHLGISLPIQPLQGFTMVNSHLLFIAFFDSQENGYIPARLTNGRTVIAQITGMDIWIQISAQQEKKKKSFPAIPVAIPPPTPSANTSIYIYVGSFTIPSLEEESNNEYLWRHITHGRPCD